MTQPYYFFYPPQHYESLQFGSSSSSLLFLLYTMKSLFGSDSDLSAFICSNFVSSTSIRNTLKENY